MTRPKDESENATRPPAGGTNPYYDDDPSPTMPGALEVGASASPTAQDGEAGTLEERIRAKMNESPRVRHDPIIGQVFGGRFEITGKIGAGGMGVVYKARQKGMDRNVAVKVLVKQFLTNDVAVKRFQREALAVSKLEHPNTVRIYDFGETPEGTPYLAMEFLTGAPLERIMRHEQQLPVRRVLRIVQQICRSLDEAHQKGIVHRDLKPDNVFVGAIEGQADYVKVLDFGVAKLRESTEGEGGTLTQHGTIFGTPKYMSPEQCRSQEVDARSDLYSVGIMMHEMLSGRVPFESDNPLSILIMHAQDPVRSLAETRPDLIIPFEVEELMHRLLGKEAEERPQSAKEVIDRCESLLHAVPDDFEQVLTYEAAQQSGKLFDRSAAFTVPDAPTRSMLADRTRRIADEGDNATLAGQHLPPIPTPVWKKAVWTVAGLALVVGGVAAFLWSRIEPLPPGSTQLMPAQWASASLPEIKAPLVTVTASANVGGVTVVDAATGELRGQIEAANTATVLGKWLQEPGRKVKLRFQRVNAAPVEREVDLGYDVTLPLAEFQIDKDKEVTLTVKASVEGVVISLAGSDQLYRTREAGAPVKIPLGLGDKAVTLNFEKAGYKKHTETFTPSSDGFLDVALEKEPEVVATPDPNKPPINTTHVVKTPKVPKNPTNNGDPPIKVTPIKDPEPPKVEKIGGIKGFK